MASPGLSLGLLRRRPAGITTDVSRSADEQQQHTHVGGDATPPSSAASRTSTARFSSIGDEDDGDMLEGMFVGSNKTRKRQQHPQGSSKSETLLAIAGFLFTMAGTAYVFPAVVLYLLYNIFAKARPPSPLMQPRGAGARRLCPSCRTTPALLASRAAAPSIAAGLGPGARRCGSPGAPHGRSHA